MNKESGEAKGGNLPALPSYSVYEGGETIRGKNALRITTNVRGERFAAITQGLVHHAANRDIWGKAHLGCRLIRNVRSGHVDLRNDTERRHGVNVKPAALIVICNEAKVRWLMTGIAANVTTGLHAALGYFLELTHHTNPQLRASAARRTIKPVLLADMKLYRARDVWAARVMRTSLHQSSLKHAKA